MKSHLYTRTGDKGLTCLIGGTRVEKTDCRIEAYGTVDELNAQLGLLHTYLTEADDCSQILKIQRLLFVIGAHLATDQSVTALNEYSTITAEQVSELETCIDRIDEQLPALKAFVIPGGTRGAAQCHVCRTVCRRAERAIQLLATALPVSAEVLCYINRLSDYLFALSRKINVLTGADEIFWDKACLR